MNKRKVKCIVLTFLLILLMSLTNIAFAGNNNFDVNQYKTPENNVSGLEFTQNLMKTGLEVVRSVAAGMAIIGLIVMGIKYLYSSPEGRASYKKGFMIYLLGMGLIILGTTIIDVLARVGESIGG